jgi:hypothetical protein
MEDDFLPEHPRLWEFWDEALAELERERGIIPSTDVSVKWSGTYKVPTLLT